MDLSHQDEQPRHDVDLSGSYKVTDVEVRRAYTNRSRTACVGEIARIINGIRDVLLTEWNLNLTGVVAGVVENDLQLVLVEVGSDKEGVDH